MLAVSLHFFTCIKGEQLKWRELEAFGGGRGCGSTATESRDVPEMGELRYGKVWRWAREYIPRLRKKEEKKRGIGFEDVDCFWGGGTWLWPLALVCQESWGKGYFE